MEEKILDQVFDRILDKLTDIECKKRLIKEAHEDFEKILEENKFFKTENKALKNENEMLKSLLSDIMIFFKRPRSEANTLGIPSYMDNFISPEHELYIVNMELTQYYGFKIALTGNLLEKLLEIYDEKHKK